MSEDLPYAHGGPAGRGTLRAAPEDFQVEEVLGFAPSGQGEHVFLRIEKRGENTEWVARQLARFANVAPRDIGYAGLKDRHACTRQWFSVHLPGRADPDWDAVNSATVTVLDARRHDRKLKRGALICNRFALRCLLGPHDPDRLARLLDTVRQEGVPNAFGEQRFGREGDNLTHARAMLSGTWSPRSRHERGILLSSARSHLFHCVLARRVAEGTWNQLLTGDVGMFATSHSFFRVDDVTAELVERTRAGSVHPSGPLWGRGEAPVTGAVRALETAALEDEQPLCRALEDAGLEMARRPLRLVPDDFIWTVGGDRLTLEFSLPPGAYATTVMRELLAT